MTFEELPIGAWFNYIIPSRNNTPPEPLEGYGDEPLKICKISDEPQWGLAKFLADDGVKRCRFNAVDEHSVYWILGEYLTESDGGGGNPDFLESCLDYHYDAGNNASGCNGYIFDQGTVELTDPPEGL